MITDDLLKDFKLRMRIFHNEEDSNLKMILGSSLNAIKRFCGSDDVSQPAIRELVFERSRYVYNDSLEFFHENFLSELLSVSLAFYEPTEEEENV